MSYRVGTKVVCVDANFDKLRDMDPDFFQAFHELPEDSKVYKVRTSEQGAIRLEEIRNPECPINLGGVEVWDEPAFASRRFAPLIEDRNEMTDSLLNDLTKEVEYEELELVEVGEDDHGPIY